MAHTTANCFDSPGDRITVVKLPGSKYLHLDFGGELSVFIFPNRLQFLSDEIARFMAVEKATEEAAAQEADAERQIADEGLDAAGMNK